MESQKISEALPAPHGETMDTETDSPSTQDMGRGPRGGAASMFSAYDQMRGWQDRVLGWQHQVDEVLGWHREMGSSVIAEACRPIMDAVNHSASEAIATTVSSGTLDAISGVLPKIDPTAVLRQSLSTPDLLANLGHSVAAGSAISDAVNHSASEAIATTVSSGTLDAISGVLPKIDPTAVLRQSLSTPDLLANLGQSVAADSAISDAIASLMPVLRDPEIADSLNLGWIADGVPSPIPLDELEFPRDSVPREQLQMLVAIHDGLTAMNERQKEMAAQQAETQARLGERESRVAEREKQADKRDRLNLKLKIMSLALSCIAAGAGIATIFA